MADIETRWTREPAGVAAEEITSSGGFTDDAAALRQQHLEGLADERRTLGSLVVRAAQQNLIPEDAYWPQLEPRGWLIKTYKIPIQRVTVGHDGALTTRLEERRTGLLVDHTGEVFRWRAGQMEANGMVMDPVFGPARFARLAIRSSAEQAEALAALKEFARWHGFNLDTTGSPTQVPISPEASPNYRLRLEIMYARFGLCYDGSEVRTT